MKLISKLEGQTLFHFLVSQSFYKDYAAKSNNDNAIKDQKECMPILKEKTLQWFADHLQYNDFDITIDYKYLKSKKYFNINFKHKTIDHYNLTADIYKKLDLQLMEDLWSRGMFTENIITMED